MENSLIIVKDNQVEISQDFKEKYKSFINLKNTIEEAQKIIKDQLIQYYESIPEEDRKQLDFDTFKVSYVKGSIRKSLDNKKLQDEEPEIYNKYLKETEVSSTIKFC